jgi:hypothetical protein
MAKAGWRHRSTAFWGLCGVLAGPPRGLRLSALARRRKQRESSPVRLVWVKSGQRLSGRVLPTRYNNMPAHDRQSSGSDGGYFPPLASASHFFMNEVFAAPDRGMPFLPMAFSARPDPAAAPPVASASHFLIDEVFAAPDRGFPALLTALDSQSDAAVATCANSILAANRQAINLDMAVVSS